MDTFPPIVLTTDFGLTDPFVGVMKGVILTINPHAVILDLTHDIPPQQVSTAAFVLGVNHPYFPPNAIHTAVVDPGVGTARRAVLLITPQARFIAPDNGLLSAVIKDYLETPPAQPGLVPLPPGLAAYELTNPEYQRRPVSSTFHGRDVFAPAAAYLSLGRPPQSFGPPVRELVWQPAAAPSRRGNGWQGEVIYIDRFGNLITNITAAQLPAAPLTIAIANRRIPGLSRTFHDPAAAPAALPDTPPLIALMGSNGYLEIAVPDGSAAQTLGLGYGAPVQVTGFAAES